MTITNLNSRKKISKTHRTADTLLSRIKGLMFSKPSESALILNFRKESKISLHMFFVFYAIDVLFVNKKGKIVDIKQNFRPFTLYTSREKASLAIELPAGSAKSSKTKTGDRIKIKN